MREYVTLRVEGNEQDLRSFLGLCATIAWLSSAGASRRIPVEVDGDGSADLRFFAITPEGDAPLQLPEAPDIELHEMKPIYIGE
jgi:hypothetical protein